MSACMRAHTHTETEMWKAPADPQALQLSSAEIPESHGPGSVKASTVPAPTFMQHSLIPTSVLYSRGQENYMYFT